MKKFLSMFTLAAALVFGGIAIYANEAHAQHVWVDSTSRSEVYIDDDTIDVTNLDKDFSNIYRFSVDVLYVSPGEGSPTVRTMEFTSKGRGVRYRIINTHNANDANWRLVPENSTISAIHNKALEYIL